MRATGNTLGKDGDSLAWIFGSSRSGSTWLLRMLSELRRVVPIDDPHLGHHLGVWRPIPLAWATAEQTPELATLDRFKRQKPDYFFSEQYREAWEPALRDLIRARFEAQAADTVAAQEIADPMVVVKEPASQVADLLTQLFPASRVIFLLRDGRDVVASWLDGYSEGAWATREGAYPVSPEGRVAMVRWQASVWLKRTETMQSIFRQLPEDSRLLIRYDHLRLETAACLREVNALLGLGESDERLTQVAEANSYENVPSERKGDGQEIRKAKPGSWRETLSAEEVEAMHEILAPKLQELGMPVESALAEPAGNGSAESAKPAA
jgi:hypothetical protein